MGDLDKDPCIQETLLLHIDSRIDAVDYCFRDDSMQRNVQANPCSFTHFTCPYFRRPLAPLVRDLARTQSWHQTAVLLKYENRMLVVHVGPNLFHLIHLI